MRCCGGSSPKVAIDALRLVRKSWGRSRLIAFRQPDHCGPFASPTPHSNVRGPGIVVAARLIGCCLDLCATSDFIDRCSKSLFVRFGAATNAFKEPQDGRINSTVSLKLPCAGKDTGKRVVA